MNFQKLCFAFVVFMTMVAFGSASTEKWEGRRCSVADTRGVWGYLATGFDSYGLPMAVLAQATADGQGNLTGWAKVDDDGVIVPATYTGTVTVAKDCTGSWTLTFPDGSTLTNNFVMDDNKEGYQSIYTTFGTMTAFAVEQGPAVCGMTGKKHTFAFNFTGTQIGVGPVAFVGQVIYDGNGNMYGTLTQSLQGTITSGVPFSGTYTENADCTGTVQITGDGNFSFIVVNGGKEHLLIHTEPGWIISGTEQQ